jgi:hypothetical protein
MQCIQSFIPCPHETWRHIGGRTFSSQNLLIAHHFSAASDDAIFHPRQNRTCSQIDGRNAAPAKAVECSA